MALTFKFDFEATKAVLLYLAAKELPNFDKYRASKLLFLADREHLVCFGRTITGDSYNALPYGPTPNRTLELLDAIRTRRETLAGFYQTLFDYQVSLLDLELATATPLQK